MLYPRIRLEYDSKYIPLTETEGIELNIFYQEKSSSTEINVTVDCDIFSLDGNVSVLDNILYPTKEGSAKIKVIYNDLYESVFFVVYNSFFRENYKMHLIPDIDRMNLQNNPILEAVLDTLFEFYDILYAYQNDIQGIKGAFETKYIYLRSLFAETGFPLLDFSKENTSLESIANKIYRNLLDDLSNIIELRGTATAYELFFAALGYDIEIFEYWFDGEANLVEINVTNPEESTFDKYDVNGNRLDESEQTYEDPRINVGTSLIYSINNKSKYIKIKYEKNENLPAEFVENKTLLTEYLNFLKPNHVEYLSLMDSLLNEDELLILDEECNFNEIDLSGEEDPPIILPPFQPSGKLLTAYGSAALLTFMFISTGQAELTKGLVASGTGEFIASNYFFEADGQILTASGEAFSGTFYFTSDGQILTASGVATSSHEDGIWDPRLYGPQINRLIYWYDYLTQQNRDDFVEGFVGGKRVPSDFYALDYSILPESRTYNDIISFSLGILLESTIQTMVRYDTGLAYDNFYYDSFAFLITNENYIYTYSFARNELKNLYTLLKSQNPQLSGESNEAYELRIKQIILNSYSTINGGTGLKIEILDELLK